MKKLITLLIVLAALGAGTFWYFRRAGATDVQYRTAQAKRQDVVSTISATGTVEPEEVIDVGAQVAGQILSFGKDRNGKQIDYGSPVESGMLMAQIDPTVYQADLTVAKAQLAQAEAGVLRAQADLTQMRAKLEQAQSDWTRAQNLGPSDALSQASYDQYKSTYAQAQANVGITEAAVTQANASVAQSTAAVDRANRNLGYCTINSPVKGVIIDRRVNVGQTVVASLNAPSLFLLAKDLTRMQVWVAVNEADIGQIHPGQPVTFSVDAYPGQTFRGQVGKVRLNASMSQNVVTFTVEVTTDNSSMKLLPYLTANVQFETNRRDDVLTVPNAALRYTPATAEQVAPDARNKMQQQQTADGSGGGGAAPGGRGRRGAGGGGDGATEVASAGPTTAAVADGQSQPGQRRGRGGRGGGEMAGATTRTGDSPATAPAPVATEVRPRRATVWVRDGEFVRPVDVRAGATDGTVTEVMSDELKEDTEVVVGEVRGEAASAGGPSGSTNPFAPTPMWRGGGGGGGGRPAGGGGGGGGGGGARPGGGR